jgi:hypothetical protein
VSCAEIFRNTNHTTSSPVNTHLHTHLAFQSAYVTLYFCNYCQHLPITLANRLVVALNYSTTCTGKIYASKLMRAYLLTEHVLLSVRLQTPACWRRTSPSSRTDPPATLRLVLRRRFQARLRTLPTVQNGDLSSLQTSSATCGRNSTLTFRRSERLLRSSTSYH